VNDNIIPSNDAHAQDTPASVRHYRIKPIILHTGRWLHIADGVLEVDGVAWLGQVQADPDTGAYQVTALVDRTGHGWHAPLGWQADIIHPEPPPPSGGGLLRLPLASLCLRPASSLTEVAA
jgi:hypothetical protein